MANLGSTGEGGSLVKGGGLKKFGRGWSHDLIIVLATTYAKVSYDLE